MSLQCGERIEMSQRERDRLKVLHVYCTMTFVKEPS